VVMDRGLEMKDVAGEERRRKAALRRGILQPESANLFPGSPKTTYIFAIVGYFREFVWVDENERRGGD
jgi:hypothetical protein